MSLLSRLKTEKIVAILRHVPTAKIQPTVQALHEGGVNILEVTMNSEGALDSIHQFRNTYDQEEIAIGAGTVLNLKMAKEAAAAGAQFFISPNLDLQVVNYAVEHDIDVWPGVMTPTEIVNAWSAGAKAVKLFPAGILGTEYLKDIKAPLDSIPIIATGGINLENQQAYFKAGAAAIGLGSQLVNKELIANNRFEDLKILATQFVKAVPKERVSQ
ncbi:bifunctional 4-hydroxy-2-oxoglutarate aldolase/2-dehydro-3-deoxy-phosphogluconate aldolase [Neobacillus sp. NPDC097160]|uniref:bifunctional 4-hydroxy-2-oxoglutarate aldolase/2-dehydro-3-deoxy-phosphogluconate aldolase n=1 Tax=Neobacillus sp. NPDC097160 TaxID=3364298 RepID=UPI00381D5B37